MRKIINDGLTKWQRYRLKDVEAYRKRKREYAKTPAQRKKRLEYHREWYRNGGGERQGHSKRQSREVRFFEKIVKDEDGCWMWCGLLDSNGYGIFCNEKVHRWSYKKSKGEIPEGLVLDHLCRNRACANPEHLDPVTNAENIRRGDLSRNGKHLAKMHLIKTHCPKGHEYSGENLRIEHRKDGGLARRCKACDREKSKRYLEKKGSK